MIGLVLFMQHVIKKWKKDLKDLKSSEILANVTQECVTYTGYLTKVLQDRVVPLSVDLSVLYQNSNERIITMMVVKKPWTYAHSYFTMAGCNYFGDDLVKLGNSTLGNLIEKRQHHDHVTRTNFEYADGIENLDLLKEYLDTVYLTLESREPSNKIILGCIINRLKSLSNLDNCIIRRSSFLLNDKIPLLTLYETFLPDLIHEFNNTGF